MDLLKYNFICPICEKEYYTYIERKNYQELAMRTKSAREIFEQYDYPYSQLFILGQCSNCLNLKQYCAEVDCSESTDNSLYNSIQELERH